MANSLRHLSLLALSGALILTGCGDGGGPVDPLNKVYATVQGAAYVDWNLDGRYTLPGDAPAPGVTTALVVQGTADTVARAVAGPDGVFRMKDVPVGRYTLVAGRGGIIGDSLQVMPIDSADMVLAANDTATREIRLSFATISISGLAQMAIGRPVAIEGIALNGYATFGDSTIHLVDATGYTRAVRVQPVTVNLGDSVRVFGKIGLDEGGRRVLLDGRAQVLAPGRQVPAVNVLSTAALATASNGTLAYAHARITGATVVDTAKIGNNWRVGVDDGSGRAELLLDNNVAFTLTNLVPGANVDATGVLAPTTGLSLGGNWQLKPRVPAELTLTFNTMTVAAARAAASGTKVVVEGRALTSSTVFGDTVHIMDGTGALRGVRIAGAVAEGDSLRLLGTMGSRNGQPLIVAATISRLGAGTGKLPQPDSLSTAVAATANAGRLDAQQVRVSGTILGTSTQPNQDLLVFVDDGSGRLDVLFSRSAFLNTTSIQPGKRLNAAGVLVPSGTAGTWRLLPRSNADFTADFPTATVAEARTLPQGKTVYISGIALTGAATFTGAVVHVSDATAAIRVLGIAASAQIFPGDSVRVLGTVAVRQGQPAINATTAEVQLVNVGLPPVPALSTAAAARADGGTRDAAQARTSGSIKAVRTDALNGDKLLDIDDGSGVLVVRLDSNIGFTGPWNVNDHADVTGVLAPVVDGTWELKPRSKQELTVTTGP